MNSFMALLRYFNTRAAENSLSLGDGSTASFFAILRKGIQEFDQNIFGCDQFGFCDQIACRDAAVVLLDSGIEGSHEVKRVNQRDFHACCFGAT